MNAFLSTVGKLLTILARWVSHISLRGVVIIIGLSLALVLPSSSVLEKVDVALLKAASYFYSSPNSTSDIAFITVPKEEISIWQSDIHSSGKLAALLSNILNSSDSKVGILLNQPIDTGSGAADSLIEQMLRGSPKRGRDTTAKILVDRKFILMDLLNNDRVVLGVRQFSFAGQKPLLKKSTFPAFIPGWMGRYFGKSCEACFEEQDSVMVARPKLEQFTVLPDQFPYVQMLFNSKTGESYNGFLIQFLRVIRGVDQNSNLVWERESGVSNLGRIVPMSPSGRLIPLHGLTQRMLPIINTIPLKEALVRNAFPQVLIITSDDNTSAQTIGAALYSVQHDAVLIQPWWASLVLMVLFLLVTLYLAFVATRIANRHAVAVSFTLIIVLLLSHISIVALRSFWVPGAALVAWLIVGHFLVVVWRIKKLRVKNLIDRADDICISQARQLIDQQELNGAFSQLRDCSVREPLLQTLYDLSEAYTEQKDYQQAIAVLSSIQNKHKSFKDTEQKLQVLTTMLKTVDEDGQEPLPLQKTVVINTESKNNVVLGRYELEKEIGRGAMGQVYLGFDPRISRRVAVKTLNYDSFKGKEKEEIKSRFFREAEAAGRLNHPSIVSVYDVGEEGDMAFIAMDFAEGKALNHFVNPDNLLPIFEVYRIICDVAQALEYAHENNIVHRDVKPGNIIYNPSPYQVKVTDFGIARLTDDSKTNTGEILGSPLYMAPEQLKGKKVNRAADIFSLGVTFYQLLTGRLPYEGDNLAALTYEIIHGKHKSVRTVRKDLPASAARITNQALQKDPEDRYETAAEMAAVLKKVIKRDFAAEAKRTGYL